MPCGITRSFAGGVPSQRRAWRATHSEGAITRSVRRSSSRASSRKAGRRDCVAAAIARLHPSKDHATLIEAFALASAADPHLRLQIVGDGPLRASLERLAARCAAPALGDGRLAFLGESAQIPTVLAACDLVILPGAREGFGLAALEAMAAGLPVIAPHGGALPELIEDGGSGLLVRPGDAAALAAAISRLARDAALRLKLGRRGRQIAERFSLEAMVAATARLYREVVPDGSARPHGGPIDTPGPST